MRERNQLREEWRDRGGVNQLGSGSTSVSARWRSRDGFRHRQPLIPVETGHRFRLEPARASGGLVEAEGAVDELEDGLSLRRRKALETLKSEHHSAVGLDRRNGPGFA